MTRSLKLTVKVEDLEAWLAAENAFIDAVSERQRLRGHDTAYFEASDRVIQRLRELHEARLPVVVAWRLAQRGAL